MAPPKKPRKTLPKASSKNPKKASPKGPQKGKPKAPPADSVRLAIPRGPLFVGSYHRIPVLINPTSGIQFDDLEFQLPDGLKAGLVSRSRDALFNSETPVTMLCCGYEPGKYALLAGLHIHVELVCRAHHRLCPRILVQFLRALDAFGGCEDDDVVLRLKDDAMVGAQVDLAVAFVQH